MRLSVLRELLSSAQSLMVAPANQWGGRVLCETIRLVAYSQYSLGSKLCRLVSLGAGNVSATTNELHGIVESGGQSPWREYTDRAE